MNGPLWSPECPSGRRIPWRLVLGSGVDELRRHGLYIFATGTGIPRYIGKAQTESLRERLSHRYLSGAFSQFQIAANYSDSLCSVGWKSLPDHVLAWYLRNQARRFLNRNGMANLDDKSLAVVSRSGKGTNVRLRHAEDLAKHGIETIWISMIPTSSAQGVAELEEKVVRVASKWNIDKGYPPLMNNQLVESG